MYTGVKLCPDEEITFYSLDKIEVSNGMNMKQDKMYFLKIQLLP